MAFVTYEGLIAFCSLLVGVITYASCIRKNNENTTHSLSV